MTKALVAIGAATVNVLTTWLAEQSSPPLPIVWIGSHAQDFMSEKVRAYIGKIQYETTNHVVGEYGELIYLQRGQTFLADDERVTQDRICLQQALAKFDDVYILSNLGGGTTSHVTPYVANIIVEKDPLMQVILTMPAKLEPRSRHEKAQQAFTVLQQTCPILHVVTNSGEREQSLVETFAKRDILLAQLLNKLLC